jgi:putative membrane protein
MSDPRVFFASERTLLSWVRTGVTVMGLGFVVARFGLFLALVSPSRDVEVDTRLSANFVGPALVFLGAAVVLGAFFNHRAYVRSLPAADVPRLAAPWLTSLLAITIAAAGLLLALYLVMG